MKSTVNDLDNRPITDINGIVTIVAVGVITDKLVFVFASGGKYMKGHDILYQISDAIITNCQS